MLFFILKLNSVGTGFVADIIDDTVRHLLIENQSMKSYRPRSKVLLPKRKKKKEKKEK